MKRAAMLYCAGVNVARFKVLNAREQLPFKSLGEVAEDNPRSYSLDEAFRLRLMHDLIGGEGGAAVLTGVGPEFAAKAVYNAMDYFPRHPLDQFEPLDWWAGAVVFEEENLSNSGENWSPNSTLIRWTSWFAGEMQGLPAWIANEAKRDSGADGSYRGSVGVVRVLIANASRAADFVRDRAQELGLPEGEFGHDVMTPNAGNI